VSQLNRLVADTRSGATATLKIVRNSRTFDVKIPIVSPGARRRR
jgi:hypothetical protein